MVYFTRRTGNFWLSETIATLCKYALISVVVVLAMLLGTACETGAKTYLETALSSLKNLPPDARLREDLEAEIAAQANSYRRFKGVDLLQASNLFRDAARAQAVDMMLNGYVGHRASTGQEFDSRIRSFLGGPLILPRMAENAARDTQKGEADSAKARRLFQQWVDSRPHRKALLNGGYKFVSTGVVQRGNKIWAIQIFWAQMPEGVKILGSGGLY